MLVNSLILEHVRDTHFRRDGRMVRSRLPECLIPLHPLPADQNILQRIVQRMPHMKLARHIRRRHHNRERLLIGVHLCMEIAAFLPALVDPVFHL